MKSLKNFRTSLFLGCLALGVAGLMIPSRTLAEGKGASKLMFSAATAQTQVVSEKTSPARCSRCTDAYTKVADPSAKGMRANSMRMAAVHGCPACQTKIVSVGIGKAKTDKVVHTCGNNVPVEASCCMAAR